MHPCSEIAYKLQIACGYWHGLNVGWLHFFLRSSTFKVEWGSKIHKILELEGIFRKEVTKINNKNKKEVADIAD